MGTGRTLLLVDDDPNVLAALAALLELVGPFHVLTAADTTAALKYMETFLIDVLLADAMLPPPQTGLELFAPAIRNNPSAAIVLMSAEFRSDLGPFPPRVVYLGKPFGKEQLVDAIDEADARAATDALGNL
jgi:CheY-like chemotaxis protein